MSDQRSINYNPVQRRPVQTPTRSARRLVSAEPEQEQPKSDFNFNKASGSVRHQQKLPTAAELAALQKRRIRQVSQVQRHQAFATQSRKSQAPPHAVQHANKPHAAQAINTDKEQSRQTGGSSRIQFAFIAAGVIVFVLGVAVSITSLRTNSQVAAQTQKAVQVNPNDPNEDAGDHPNETPLAVSAVTSYKVAPDAPRRISIPKINLNARILSLGTKPNNELKTPASIYDTGWFDKSAKPGQQGAMLIDGHVSGPTKSGVFGGLKKLVKNDIIEVERGDGTVVKYSVVKSQAYDQDNTDMVAAMTPIISGKPGLNLITCEGKYNKPTNRYSERRLVFATLVE